MLSEAEVSPNYQKLLDHGDARSVGDILAAGSETSIEKRLRSFADAGTTDVSVRVVPIGADARREAGIVAAHSRVPRLARRLDLTAQGAAMGTFHESERLPAAWAERRAVLGDEYVDAAQADPDPAAADFQDHLTSMAWGVWARGGPLSRRDRSLLVLAMTAALGRMEEFRLHAATGARTGVTDAEIDELLLQIAAYCGAPAAVAARREIRTLRQERDGRS